MYSGFWTEEPLTGHGCQLVDRLLVVLFLILHRFIQKNNNRGTKMPYVTNPFLIRHHSAAVTRQNSQNNVDGLEADANTGSMPQHTTGATITQPCQV